MTPSKDNASRTDWPPGLKYLNSIPETVIATGRSRSGVYQMIAAGELDARKDGSRIFVTGESILARTKNLPKATIGKAQGA